MERIKLSKTEKKVLFMLSAGLADGQTAVPSDKYALAIRSLHDKGFVFGAFVEGGGVEAARLTNKGRLYLYDNPNLNNPIDWSKVAAITGILALIVAVIALFVSCSRILMYE